MKDDFLACHPQQPIWLYDYILKSLITSDIGLQYGNQWKGDYILQESFNELGEYFEECKIFIY